MEEILRPVKIETLFLEVIQCFFAISTGARLGFLSIKCLSNANSLASYFFLITESLI